MNKLLSLAIIYLHQAIFIRELTLLIDSVLKIIYLIKECAIKTLRILIYSATNFPHCFVCGRRVLYCPICRDCDKKFYTIESLNEVKKLAFKNIDALYSPFSYFGYDEVAFTRWKMHGVRALTPFYCKKLDKLLTVIKMSYSNIAFTVVPPRASKIKTTGYDQMVDIKNYLHYHYNYHFYNLLRRLSTAEQKSLSGVERLATIGRSYTVNYDVNRRYVKVPPIVCILDDLATTGSTLESCAMALKEHGAKMVIALTIYYTI